MKMPQWIVSIVDKDKGEEYMVAAVCNEHRAVVADLINDVNINFTRVKSVATACTGLKF